MYFENILSIEGINYNHEKKLIEMGLQNKISVDICINI